MANRYYADTNVILRILTGDDEAQIQTLVTLFEREAIRLVVTSTVVTELCWILTKYYKFKQEDAGNALLALMEYSDVEFEEEGIIQKSLQEFKRSSLDFVDCYLSAKAIYSRLPVLTWDNDFRKLEAEFYKPEELL
ncbi:PIN domain nuclease [Paenibacillus agaridevorans]|uniref:PIN domain nuclease n=1 Tax=Paenibacillus agaridevorans TaxID=171404 RepID=A0A2R5EJU2_9BACL|nr:PIN domain-containing protein [Paenibacillus agaridevorans]GBG06882.1 PIN domain nuclease [Paenibacillus agaridevorans]